MWISPDGFSFIFQTSAVIIFLNRKYLCRNPCSLELFSSHGQAETTFNSTFNMLDAFNQFFFSLIKKLGITVTWALTHLAT